MTRAVITATLLEDLHRQGRELRLPKNSLVTPAARDWLKEHPVPVAWEETGDDQLRRLVAVIDPTLPELRLMRTLLDRFQPPVEVIEPRGGRNGIAAATSALCERISRQTAMKGVVFAQDGALPVCLANKHRGIRAALGVNLPTVAEATRSLAINVLVMEYPALTPYQMRQMIDRLIAGPVMPPEETAKVFDMVEQGAVRANR
jgi:ribose 5-phosphate isomerase RpiB